jgi:uncharacterized OB-fold protein
MSSIITEFREGLARGELPIQTCGACGKPNMYPRYACPHCQSGELGWQAAAGAGTLMSFTVLRAGAPEGFEDELPYALGVVRLDEGVQLLGRLMPDADGEWASYACDAPVAFVPGRSGTYAWFGHAG